MEKKCIRVLFHVRGFARGCVWLPCSLHLHELPLMYFHVASKIELCTISPEPRIVLATWEGTAYMYMET